MDARRWPVWLWPPNLLMYVRLGLVAWAWACEPSAPLGRRRLALLALSYLIDTVDGALARALGQCSALGSFLDGLCDMCAHLANYAPLLASYWSLRCLMLLEVCTFAAATFATRMSDDGWKAALQSGGRSWTRVLLRAFFARGQRNALSLFANVGHCALPVALSWALPRLGGAAGSDIFAAAALAAAAAGAALYALVTALMLPILVDAARPFGRAWHAACAPVDCAVFFIGASAACLGGTGAPAPLLALSVGALLPLLPRGYFLPCVLVFYEGLGGLLAPHRCAPAASEPDRRILALEAALFGGALPSHDLRAALALPRALGELCYASYVLAYVPLLVLTVLYICATQRGAALERLLGQLGWTCALLWTLNCATNVQGPMVLAGAGVLPAPDPAQMGYYLPHLARRVGGLASTGTAFPSGHCAIAVCCLCMLSRCGVGPRALGAVGATVSLLVFSTVWTGMHYALDSIAGVALALVVHRLTADCAPPAALNGGGDGPQRHHSRDSASSAGPKAIGVVRREARPRQYQITASN